MTEVVSDQCHFITTGSKCVIFDRTVQNILSDFSTDTSCPLSAFGTLVYQWNLHFTVFTEGTSAQAHLDQWNTGNLNSFRQSDHEE